MQSHVDEHEQGHHQVERLGRIQDPAGVAGHVQLQRGKGGRAKPHDLPRPHPLHPHVGAALGQQLLRVGSGGDRLTDNRLALGAQTGQQDARLDLSAGDGRGEVDAAQGTAPHDQRWQPAAIATVDRGSHAP